MRKMGIEKRLRGIGTRIKRRRVAFSITQNSLAQKSGLSPNYICLLETGKRVPSYWALEKISHVLKTSPEGLLLGRTISSSRCIVSESLVSTRELNKLKKIIQLIKTIGTKEVENLLTKITKDVGVKNNTTVPLPI